ncbi:MAG: CCA tRNA nucleotidyltransferase [Cyanobacteriota bacterium]|nr:CCA tRNA nucleotidyltransferase [Cyanobacteriota bacterium]
MVSALSPQTWPFSLEWLPPSAYLVGGAVRDALLDRASDYLDLDFVLPEKAVDTARELARQYRAGFVLLDPQRQIARVVFEVGTADFAQQEGETLEKDLYRRDFTTNAIAYNPHRETFFDPLGGRGDLQRHWLRMVAPENLKDDPLRLLRAYRQAAQLGFTLEPETEKAICQFAPLLGRVAAERVNSECGYLLGTAKGTPWLVRAWKDGLLSVWFPSANAEGIARLSQVDRAVKTAIALGPDLAPLLHREIRSTLRTTQIAIAKLATLVATDPQSAEKELLRLKYSRPEIRGVVSLLSVWNQANSTETIEALSIRELFFWFKGIGDLFPAFAVFALASGIAADAIAPLVDRYLDPNDPVAHPKPLLSGKDLMRSLDIPKGPQIGRLLTAIQIARAEGKIATPCEAIAFCQREMGEGDDAVTRGRGEGR